MLIFFLSSLPSVSDLCLVLHAVLQLVLLCPLPCPCHAHGFDFQLPFLPPYPQLAPALHAGLHNTQCFTIHPTLSLRCPPSWPLHRDDPPSPCLSCQSPCHAFHFVQSESLYESVLPFPCLPCRLFFSFVFEVLSVVLKIAPYNRAHSCLQSRNTSCFNTTSDRL